MESDVHHYLYVVLEQYLDSFGHMNNAAYMTIYEAARWELITKNGYGLNEVFSSGLGPVILEAVIRYKRELRVREKITVVSQVVSYQKRIGITHQKILNEEGVPCSTAEFKFGLFDTRQRCLVPPTEKWLKALGIRSL